MGNITEKEFKGSVRIVVEENGVKIWVNDDEKSIFRFKFIGSIHGSENEFVVLGKESE